MEGAASEKLVDLIDLIEPAKASAARATSQATTGLEPRTDETKISQCPHHGVDGHRNVVERFLELRNVIGNFRQIQSFHLAECTQGDSSPSLAQPGGEQGEGSTSGDETGLAHLWF